jgi:hypothetical protein
VTGELDSDFFWNELGLWGLREIVLFRHSVTLYPFARLVLVAMSKSPLIPDEDAAAQPLSQGEAVIDRILRRGGRAEALGSDMETGQRILAAAQATQKNPTA